jgi:hypothetical protein
MPNLSLKFKNGQSTLKLPENIGTCTLLDDTYMLNDHGYHLYKIIDIKLNGSQSGKVIRKALKESFTRVYGYESYKLRKVTHLYRDTWELVIDLTYIE